MDIVEYHIFINLIVNCISNFALVRTAVLFRLFFPCYKKFFFNNKKEDYSPKWKRKKQ